MKFRELKELQKNAYCKYSNFKVSSIVICDNDKEFYGVNVENAAFGDTICAERSAMVSAVSNGYSDFKELHLLTDSQTPKQGTPCGSCRQVMAELLSNETKIYIYGQNGDIILTNIMELLPLRFNL